MQWPVTTCPTMGMWNGSGFKCAEPDFAHHNPGPHLLSFCFVLFIHLSEHVSFQPAAEQGLGFWKYKLNKSTDFVERAGVCGFPLPWMQEGLDRSGQPGAVVF
ncbi:unnamed protein product [Gadus morhua 'NCC']